MRLKTILPFLALATISLAQAATRAINVAWTPPAVTAGITGYVILTSSTPTGTFTPIGCVGSVAGSTYASLTCVAGSTASTTSFIDASETVGTAVSYEVITIGIACTPTTPIGTACGAAGTGGII